jgi:hypothetical protein
LGKYDGILCKYEGCDRAARNRGYCGKHYNQLWSAGVLTKRTPMDRFVERLRGADTEFAGAKCILWSGARSNGYGYFGVDGLEVLVHRWIYEQKVGPIPLGHQIDHLCRVRLCVNVLHLEAVTPYQNNMRSDSPAAINARKIHCDKDHPLVEANLYDVPSGKRKCKTCSDDASREWKRRNRGLVPHE